MALGFKMGASGEKPKTETYNVTENGTFDMGAKNPYRYVNANIAEIKIGTRASIHANSGTRYVTLSGFSGTDTVNTRTIYLLTRSFSGVASGLSSVSNASATFDAGTSSGNAYNIDYTVLNVPIVANHYKFEKVSNISGSNPATVNYGWTANSTGRVRVIAQTNNGNTEPITVTAYSTYATISISSSYTISYPISVQIVELK